jgi:hypothetical protein
MKRAAVRVRRYLTNLNSVVYDIQDPAISRRFISLYIVILLLLAIIIIIQNVSTRFFFLPDVVNIAFRRCQHDLPAWLYPLSP